MKNLLRSRLFRYGVAYAGLFFVSTLLVLTFLYFVAFNIVDQKIEERLLHEALWLSDLLRQAPQPAMVERLNFYIADHPGNQGIYLLLDAEGQRLAGNLDYTPLAHLTAGVMASFLHQDSTNKEEPLLHIKATVAPGMDGYRLIVGHNFQAIDQIKLELRPVAAWTLAFSFFLGVVVAIFLTRRLALRLDKINKSSRAILQGNLEARMDVTGSGDEFDNLSRHLNLMLDRIFNLMASIRGVTDNIAHDLRSPLSRMRSRMDVTLLRERTVDEYQDALVETVEDTDRLLAAFNSLLTIARVESGAQGNDFVVMDAGRVTTDTAEMYEPLVEDKGQSLRVLISGDLSMTGNPDLLIQALTNLLDNAIKYCPAGAVISLRTSRVGDFIVLEVCDNGPGIPTHFREKAMQRFTRLDASRSQPGQGLGLALVEVVAEMHGGSVTLQDANPGLCVVLNVAVLPASSLPAFQIHPQMLN